MERYESAIKVVKASDATIFDRLTDLAAIGQSLPPQLVKDWEATADECHFSVDKVGRVGVKIEEKQPFGLVKYGVTGQVPIGMSLFVQIKPAPDDANESRIRLTLLADIPFMLKAMVGGKLQELVDKLADAFATRLSF